MNEGTFNGEPRQEGARNERPPEAGVPVPEVMAALAQVNTVHPQDIATGDSSAEQSSAAAHSTQASFPPATLDPPPPLHGAQPHPTPPEMPDFQWETPGQQAASLNRVGRYTLLGELGRGGMGVVYRAWDPQLDRAVALKMLLWGGVAGEVRRKRFVREAQAIARLEHPAIVRIYDTGVRQGCPFYTMDFVAGETLQQRLEHEGSLSPTEALRIIAVIARALHHAHERGIVHRDIKPANILLEEGRNPRLSDFGIAQLGEGEGDLTQTGQVVGTPAYMAPEQALGLPGTIGPQADVYALGAVLYHLLTGKLPFERAGHLQPALRSTLEAPSPRLVKETLPGDVVLLCRKAMAPAPSDRYPSALALAEDAERFLRGEPVLASTPTLVRRLQWRLYQSRALLTGGISAMLVLLMLAGIWRTYKVHEAETRQQEREQVALSRLTALKAQFPATSESTQLEQATIALDAFADLSEVQRTRAHAQGLLHAGELEQAAGELSSALDHYARAWLVAHNEKEQVGALLAMGSIFEALGDRERFQALRPILGRFDASSVSATGMAHFELFSALSARDFPTLLRRLSGPAVQDFMPLLQRLGQIKRSGIVSTMLGYSMHGSAMPFAMTSRQDTSVPMLDTNQGQTSGLPIIKVAAPEGTYFDNRMLDLGRLQGERLLLVSLRQVEDDTPERTLCTLKGTSLVRHLPLSLSALSSSVTADLNGDGVSEIYVAADRRLMTLTFSESGAAVLTDAHPETSRSNSDINRVLAVDLDGDNRQELVTTNMAWRAYDVRVFKAGARPGELKLVALRRMGSLWDAAPFALADGTMGLAVSRNVMEPNTRAFPNRTPAGMPVGIYVLKLNGNQLDIKEYIPPPFKSAQLGRLLSGDFDGDGRMDLAVQVLNTLIQATEIHHDHSSLQLITRRPDGHLAQLTLPDLVPWQALNLDSDPATEILAVARPSNELWALGVAGEPMPLVERAFAAGQQMPMGLSPSSVALGSLRDDPWARIDLLATLGLTQAGGRELITLATTASDIGAAAQRLSQAAALMAQSGKVDEAEALLRTVLKRAPQSIHALTSLTALYRLNWRHEDERRVLSRAMASPERNEADMPAMKSRLDWLDRLNKRRSDVLDTAGELDPRWHLVAPFQVGRDLQQDTLVVKSYAQQGNLLHAPLIWDGGRLTLTFNATIRRAEWGSTLFIGVRPEGGGPEDLLAGIKMASGGGGEQLMTHADLILKDKTALPAWGQLSQDVDTPFELDLRLEIAPETGEVYVNVNGLHRIETLLAPVRFDQGNFELAITGFTGGQAQYGMIEVGLHSLHVQGGHFPSVTPGPDQQGWRKLLEGEYAEAQRMAASLRQSHPVDAEHIQYLTQCRSGAQAACLTTLTRLLRSGGPGKTQLNDIIREQLHTAPSIIYPTLQRLMGYQALLRMQEAWGNAPHAHASNPAVLLATTTAPSDEDLRRLPPPRTLEEKLSLLEVMVVRTQSLMLLKQYDAAISYSSSAQGFGEQLLNSVSDAETKAEVQAQLSSLERTLARAFARKGKLAPTLKHLERALDLSPVRRVLGEELAVLPEFAHLFKYPGFTELLRPTVYTMPVIPAVRGL